MEDSLHMTIGENLAQILLEIADERLIKLEIQEAIKVLTDSLIGMPDEMAIDILRRNSFIGVEMDTQQILMSSKNDIENLGAGHIKDPKEYIKFKIKGLISRAGDIGGRNTVIGIERLLSETYDVTIDHRDILDIYEDENPESVSEKIKTLFYNNDAVSGIGYVLIGGVQWLEDYAKLKQLNHFFGTDIKSNILEYALDEVEDILFKIRSKSKSINLQDGKGTMLDNYLKATKGINEKLEDGIKPNAKGVYNDAGWISPDGLYYGLDGEIANMLHNQIQDSLFEQGLISDKDACYSLGWLKQHSNHFLYDGYYYDNMSITDKQREVMEDIVENKYACSVRLGLQQIRLSLSMLKMIEPMQFKNKFFKL